MTAEWFDLGQRLRASTEVRVVPRLERAPFAGAYDPIAVRASVKAGTATATLAGPGAAPVTVNGQAAILEALASLGAKSAVSGATFAASIPQTLITDDPATLPALLSIANDVDPKSPYAEVAARIGWWANRADFPGTSAVVNLPSACRAMWVTGEDPVAEKNPSVWRRWLGIQDASPSGMLTILDRLQARGSLPLLDELRLADVHDWLRVKISAADGYDWRAPDHVGRAAVGLAARCAASEVFAGALLSDPLWRRRAVHTGHVVSGRLIAAASGTATIECPRLDARMRPEAGFVGWAGKAGYVPRHRFKGTLSSTATAGTSLLLTAQTGRSQLPPVGAVVTLMPAPPRPHAISQAIRRYVYLYSTRTSWLTTGRTPIPSRRDVPLEVLVAAAEQE